ncbi:ribonuclease H2, subunit B [Xylogone sp. PMI_703]|nr:ribonuclease H2, subunit B [Xylogone sp. PMI_703]
MKTRSKGSDKAETQTAKAGSSSVQKIQLAPESATQPLLFVLPKNASSDARIVTISNPRTQSKNRYFVCPKNGFYEFTKISAPRATARSWLLAPETLSTAPAATETTETPKLPDNTATKAAQAGYVMKNADLFLATSIDPLFLLLPSLFPTSTSKTSEPTKQLFLSGDDYFDRILEHSPQLQSFFRVEYLRNMLNRRMSEVCDTVDAGDEQMYRVNEEKLLKVLIQKARNMSEKGLPASMEEKFVRKALEVPILSIKLGGTTRNISAEEKDTIQSTRAPSIPQVDASKSQGSSSTSDLVDSPTPESLSSTSASQVSTTLTTPDESSNSHSQTDAPESITDLLRLRTALYYICSNYISPHIAEKVKTLLGSSTSPVDFSPLDTHLIHLQKLRQEAAATISMGDYTRKRVADEEEDEIRAEKRRKKEEEEKRKKAGESRAVKNLKKVNVTGMKKMSDFFKKK